VQLARAEGGAVPPISPAVLPRIVVSTRDFGRLENLARIHMESAHPVADLLLAELERATVCAPDAVGSDVVTMNARVTFRAGPSMIPRSATVVYPEDYHPTGQHVSVMSPLGAAMLGLRAGERMPYTDLQGTRFSVKVDEVAYRP
jgi:regulator of nucleoside diphosphate kinase